MVMSGFLQLELEAVVRCLTWLLGTKFSVSGRAASTLDHRAISLGSGSV